MLILLYNISRLMPNEIDQNKFVSSNSDIWIENMERKYREANKRIQKVCQRYRKRYGETFDEYNKTHQFMTPVKNGFYTNIMFDENHKLAYCRHAKVGSSTWINYFLKLSPHIAEESLKIKDLLKMNKLMNMTSTKFQLPFKSITQRILNNTNHSFPISLNEFMNMQNIMSFSFVRHPFQRLVSAYIDKVLNWRGEYMKYIGYKDWFENDHSFPSFVENVVLHEYKKDSCYQSYNKPCLNIDKHWMPFNSRCFYCDISYNVIGKLETFRDDVNYISLKQNLTNLIPLLPDHPSSGTKMHTSVNKTKQYFAQLNKIQIQQLCEMFQIDFELFGYASQSYLI